ncbi:MAG: 5-methylcytosine-specific restriction enzyme [Methylobacteriaceae bacterium]|nr:5-methylcytosine-specific restriction enzyme [Methylobacteriaceae bacterium]
MKSQLRLLNRLNAPDALVSDFIEKCRINEHLEAELRATPVDLLEESCRKFGFDSVFDDGWFFRPYRSGGVSHRNDIAVQGDEAEAPAIEQAYRRGYNQGFAHCRRMVIEGRAQAEIVRREREIHAWRVRNVQRFASIPGDKEKPARNLFGGRSALSVRVRWKVFKRDGFKCVVCGRTATDDVRLEVDHIHPVSHGGDDSETNLRTLCNLCNAGKSNLI